MADSPDTNPSSEMDEIPVDELIRMTREFTRRINNQDRHRLGVDLRESGHSRSLTISAPITLQQFFSGEIDLDTDLARRFLNAPLLSHSRFIRSGRQPGQRQETAIFSTNDDSFFLTVDSYQEGDSPDSQAVMLEFTFTMVSALALRFRLTPLTNSDRSRWLDLMDRASGIAFLWTRDRWEKPYLIFVVREHFARLYAFSPTGIEAAARMTPDMISGMLDWLEGMWFPDRKAPKTEEKVMHVDDTLADAPGWDMPAPSPDRPQLSLRSLIPDAPEEQWDEEDVPPERPPDDVGYSDDWGGDDGAAPDTGERDLSPDDLEW
jgi:acyl-CoA synthetase (AMP-forming)/AMP-acid ligase II